MRISRAWTIWPASLLVCPLVIFAIGLAFRTRWLPPDHSGWSDRDLSGLLLVHVLVSLAAAVAPPRPARGGRYWLALGFVLAVFWLTILLMMGTSMASYYE